jgi:putative Holliday junction resolvase
MPRFLGIDYGTKRIGLAISDADATIASPLAVIVRQGGLDEQVRDVLRAADEYGFEAAVLGLPLNMDGTVGPQAELTRKFGAAFARISGKPVHEWDERLSSRGAEELFAGRQLSRGQKKLRRDALAALIILQGYLDAHRPPGQ